MDFEQEIFNDIKELALHYPYSFEICKYVYMAHGSKAEEIIKMCCSSEILFDHVCDISDICQQYSLLYPLSGKEAADHLKRIIERI